MGRRDRFLVVQTLDRPPSCYRAHLLMQGDRDHPKTDYFRFGGSDTVPFGLRTAVCVVT